MWENKKGLEAQSGSESCPHIGGDGDGSHSEHAHGNAALSDNSHADAKAWVNILHKHEEKK